jgi:hypothetical protein
VLSLGSKPHIERSSLRYLYLLRLPLLKLWPCRLSRLEVNLEGETQVEDDICANQDSFLLSRHQRRGKADQFGGAPLLLYVGRW